MTSPSLYFTTRPDTLYGATYMVLAPEHELVDRITPPSHRETIEAYRTMVAGKSDRDRLAETKEKTGVFTGAFAINPMNAEHVPIYIADYVLMGYGTGAIMAVPAHDERDFEFAKKYSLPIRFVVQPTNAPTDRAEDFGDAPYVHDGVAVNSPIIDGLKTADAIEKMISTLQANGAAYKSVKYKLRDWLFSRQRYWGEPFPIVLDEHGNAHAIPEVDLPLTLPQMDDFKPTGTPEPPLGKALDWVKYSRDGASFTRETNTMPQWAGSCWYYLRYIDPKNTQRFVDPEKEKYWMPVDLYVGGVEHAVLHLLYARFWHKVLFDLGHVSTPEPFGRLVNQGLILGEMEYHAFVDSNGEYVSTVDVKEIDEEATSDGTRAVARHRKDSHQLVGRRIDESMVEKSGDGFVLKSDRQIKVDARSFKMSKSRGNVVNPDSIVADYGADTFRLYEMYLGPLEQQKPWNTRDIVGMSRFLSSVYRNLIGEDPSLADGVPSTTPAAALPQNRLQSIPIPEALDRMMHRTIKKVADDIATLRFNTAIAELIKLNNELTHLSAIPRELAENFILMLAPFAPHLAEELWLLAGHHKSLARRPWPTYDPAKLVESTIEIPVQVNGKLRDVIKIAMETSETDVLVQAAAAEKVAPYLSGRAIKKQLYVPKKLVNFVV